ncbi:hypothetical protein 25138ceduo_00021 [Lactococcus phage STA251]|jgi:hypothetical protein|uniref:Uncharacterized protein n=1 Tax=Lactococcus phage vB_Llc_bIBBp6/4 TaxID=2305489 RepID=A0A678VGS3_9CAUD|nr:hypothetical protein KMC93_gp21 [Lactococcus phage vB_Llc_bIBBp6/4]WLW38647.1 hypothetical protein 28ceduo_00021 [Lactococcus phage STA28]WLW38761.1 hypothetical protein 135ceduo_00021 [Lactococcus phage STA135]WLW38837.1 hypothetical protein 173ceduo_00021 [Lactococcus phage STA173]WLW38951.1 hypothetical protein 25138ceduo_00021 [Lactococcus phage STA251]DAJ10056.1 MAG TPA: hypothetical protein [Caudoviricetes sp.]
MDLQHKIDRTNILYDEIYRLESKYETYEEINHDDLIKIIRMHDIAFDMTVDLIKKGAW